VLRGHVRAFDAMLRRQRGDIVATPAPPSEGAARGSSAESSQLGPKLSEAFALWQEGNGAAGARKPGRSGVLEAKPAARWFTELHGDIRLGEITKAHARDYQRALVQVPKRLPDDLRGLSLRQLLARNLEGYERRGATTINKSIGMLGAIISYAQREGLLDCVPGFVNPFARDVKLRVDKRAEEDREPFQPSDLAAIFGAGVFRSRERPAAGAGEAAFWFPLIALLSGMRLDEIAGLRLQDLHQDEETGGMAL
jgi:integrase